MTPEAIVRSYDTSIIVRRWLGCWVDFIALLAIFLIPDALNHEMYQRLLPVWVTLGVAYFPLTEGLFGRSLGKLATRTVVVNAQGENPGIGRAFVRTLLRIVEVNPLFLGGVPAGIIAATSKTKQRLGDMAANTFVLKQEHLRLLGPGNLDQSPVTLKELTIRKRSKWAVAAGYLGLCSVILFPAPFALIAGILGVRDLKQHPEKGGMAGAVFGIVMGCLGTAVIALAIIAPHIGQG
jgi:uncharacterized RDD family membrane protein YckC